jgi:uncharacterized protein
MTPTTPDHPADPATGFLDVEAFDELDAILDDLRTRYDETPQWEFCEGFMAAVICSRRIVESDEYLEALLAVPADGAVADAEDGSFASDAQRSRFMTLWQQRWTEVATALDSEVDSLEDDRCYHPEVMDVRGAVASMTPEEQLTLNTGPKNGLPRVTRTPPSGSTMRCRPWLP